MHGWCQGTQEGGSASKLRVRNRSGVERTLPPTGSVALNSMLNYDFYACPKDVPIHNRYGAAYYCSAPSIAISNR